MKLKDKLQGGFCRFRGCSIWKNRGGQGDMKVSECLNGNWWEVSLDFISETGSLLISLKVSRRKGGKI